MNKNKEFIKSTGSLRSIIWGFQLAMLVLFLIFSLLPLLSFVLLIIPNFNPYIIILSIILIFLLASVTIIGIISLHSNLRLISACVFSVGTFFNFFDPYLLSLGFVISWLFYELWFQLMLFRQIDDEYNSYLPESIERKKLVKSFQDQITSFGLFAWIVLLITWGILFITSNFFIELGLERGFGTLGVAISITIILSAFFARNLLKNRKKQQNS
ncbi:MAG: hypothetical protein ACFFBD_22530 [Candidatus Hodarchaeota archaeon]